MTAVMQHKGPLTWADFEAMPDDDSHRYEIIDGVLIASPTPRPLHQRAVGQTFRLFGPPLLVVEVLSPGNRGMDLVSKRTSYERFGCPSYWIVDPDIPTLLELQLRDGRYIETGNVKADEPFQTTAPFAVSFTPSSLVA